MSAINNETFILVVDDQNTNIDLITRMLARTKHKVITAFDGVEACQILQEITPALILSDIMMPNMDGYSLLKEVRANPLLANVPFVFLSAKGNALDVQQGITLGADDYLVKPFRPQELFELVDRHLSARA